MNIYEEKVMSFQEKRRKKRALHNITNKKATLLKLHFEQYAKEMKAKSTSLRNSLYLEDAAMESRYITYDGTFQNDQRPLTGRKAPTNTISIEESIIIP
jgi:hypothetical protein